MKPKLVKPSDRELDEAVAQYVAGWRRVHGEWRSPEKATAIERTCICTDELEYPPFYSTRADAVLPLFPKELFGNYWTVAGGYLGVRVCVWNTEQGMVSDGEDKSFPRAACIALLRAHGVEVET